METKIGCIIAAIKNKDMRHTTASIFIAALFFNCNTITEKKYPHQKGLKENMPLKILLETG
jgi:hypothetical protein